MSNYYAPCFYRIDFVVIPCCSYIELPCWYLYKQWLCNTNVIKFIKVTSSAIWHKSKNAERLKTSFAKDSVENADLYKPVLNKIMTAHE